MIADELLKELRDIAFCEDAKPANRVGACASLARNGVDLHRVQETLFEIATSLGIPDAVKIRAIDLMDKLDIQSAPRELTEQETRTAEKELLEAYVRTTKRGS